MKSLQEEVDEILNAKSSKKQKEIDLIKLGIRKHEIQSLFKVYKLDDDKAMPYTLGVEIECYNVNRTQFFNLVAENGLNVIEESYNHNTKNHYKIVGDSSIRGENGLECVSPVLKGKSGLTSLKKVCNALRDSGAQVNRSTGLHVHVGLQNIKFEQYKNIFINYYFLESAIDKFMSASRRYSDNSYCKSVRRANLNELQTSYDKETLAHTLFNDRYCKLNPVSYLRHNTIEFRQHQGTTDYEKIEMWVKFICKLVKWSKNNRLEFHVHNIEDIPFLSNSEKEYFINRAAVLA